MVQDNVKIQNNMNTRPHFLERKSIRRVINGGLFSKLDYF